MHEAQLHPCRIQKVLFNRNLQLALRVVLLRHFLRVHGYLRGSLLHSALFGRTHCY